MIIVIMLLSISLAACQPDVSMTPASEAIPDESLSTETPTPDPAVEAYLTSVNNQMDAMSASLSEISTRLKTPDVTDSEWKRAIAMHAGLVGVVLIRLKALTPPPEIAVDHAALIAVVEQCHNAMSEMVDALDALDTFLIAAANESMAACESRWVDVSGG